MIVTAIQAALSPKTNTIPTSPTAGGGGEEKEKEENEKLKLLSESLIIEGAARALKNLVPSP